MHETRAPAAGRPVAIGLGSNLGDRAGQLRRAVEGLRHHLDEVLVSRVYETAPVHVVDQPNFLNACSVGRTPLTPWRLLAALQDLERALGRRMGGQRYGPRPIDLDLLLFGQSVIDETGLVVPHPKLRERAFVLVPLAELAGDWVVPASHGEPGATVGRLVSEVDTMGVELTNLDIDGI